MAPRWGAENIKNIIFAASNINIMKLPHPAIMGILNVTPDSFSDGGKYNTVDNAVRHCGELLEQGADIVDIGGCSTRPNNPIATEQEEQERLIPALKAIRKEYPQAVISIDTFRKSIAEEAMNQGADIINDISGGLFDNEMLPYIGQNRVPYVLMHCVGTPETMHQYSLSGDIHQTVMEFFEKQCAVLEGYGHHDIILDPGLGFGKSLEANYALLRDLDRYRYHNYPILIGVSRKSMIRKVGGNNGDPDSGTALLNRIALLNGADIVRVHNVKLLRD